VVDGTGGNVPLNRFSCISLNKIVINYDKQTVPLTCLLKQEETMVVDLPTNYPLHFYGNNISKHKQSMTTDYKRRNETGRGGRVEWIRLLPRTLTHIRTNVSAHSHSTTCS
jgi:hypothetical protein